MRTASSSTSVQLKIDSSAPSAIEGVQNHDPSIPKSDRPAIVTVLVSLRNHRPGRAASVFFRHKVATFERGLVVIAVFPFAFRQFHLFVWHFSVGN